MGVLIVVKNAHVHTITPVFPFFSWVKQMYVLKNLGKWFRAGSLVYSSWNEQRHYFYMKKAYIFGCILLHKRYNII